MKTPVEQTPELTAEQLAALNTPAAPGEPVIEAPLVEAPVAPLEEAPLVAVLEEAPVADGGVVHMGSPSDWEIVSGPEDTIIATNRHSNAVYEGSMDGFNALLRG